MCEESENKLRSSTTCHSPIGVTYGERALFFQVKTEEEEAGQFVCNQVIIILVVSAARRPRIMLTTDLISSWATNNLTGRLEKWLRRRLLEQSSFSVFVNEIEKLIHKLFLSHYFLTTTA